MHPGNPHLVMTQYRRRILSCKKRWSTARGLIHYKVLVQTYLWAKRQVLSKPAPLAGAIQPSANCAYDLRQSEQDGDHA
jgi:hypothetical protein